MPYLIPALFALMMTVVTLIWENSIRPFEGIAELEAIVMRVRWVLKDTSLRLEACVLTLMVDWGQFSGFPLMMHLVEQSSISC